ncbi:MAG: ABC transporter permease [Planctomycetota bacterium]|nr:ABC transporter permease [Planctomycetota bacterium]
MTRGTLVLRGLVYHWRAHLGVLLGAAVGGAVLVGALLVGDSVRYTLREMAAARLGGVRLALPGGERTFRAELAEDFAHAAGGRAAPVLMLSGTAARADGASRANRVQVLGIEPRFWALGGGRDPLAGAPPDSVVLNERLAGRLGAGPGDTVILRMQKPSRLSRDAPLSPEEDAAVAWRLTVAGVAGDADFGRFSLQANQVPPFNAYVPLERLQAKVAVPGRVNLLLSDAEGPAEEAGAKLAGAWRLEDADLSLKAAPLGPELRSGRVFVDAPISAAALKPIEGAAPPRGILTYLVNELRFGEKSVPYSMVAALDGEPIPAGLGDEEIAVNAWLAEDLGCKTGDEIELAYFEVGAMRTLVEVSARFKVRAVVPLEGAARDPSLMPDFPGLKDSKDCKDWDPGFPLKLDRIRDRDETYWDEHKGTPKAFVSLKAGRAMWANRFGDLTAVRYPGATEEAVREALRARLRPEMAGLAFVDAGAQARIAGAQALDFGPLFIGFSFFLIAAAVLLMGLLFAFGVERRASETGILLAVGFRPGVARRLMLLEAAVPAALGGALGTLGGLVYARAMLHGLSTLWRDAVRTSALRFHAEPATLAIGALASTLVAFGAIWLVLRRQRKLEARELLAGSAEGAGPAPAGGRGCASPPRSAAWARRDWRSRWRAGAIRRPRGPSSAPGRCCLPRRSAAARSGCAGWAARIPRARRLARSGCARRRAGAGAASPRWGCWPAAASW